MKRIITCSDGTWNHPGETDKSVCEETNVLKMYRSICAEEKKENDEDVKQLKVYDQGVGTGTSLRDKIVGGATGAGIDKNIKDVYSFLVLNYAPGDEIYFFGFSRGAYTARSLAGFVRNCGILKPQYFHLIGTAYDLYRDRNSYSKPDSDLMKSFRSNYAYEDVTRIKFIGVWDTVGSLGVPLRSFKSLNTAKYKFHDTTLSSTIDYAYHALAIDERRGIFEPTLWEKSETVQKGNYPQVMEQCWFAGVHSNIGGGYADCGLSNITLDWFIKKAMAVGLCFNKPPLIEEDKDRDKGKVINSFTPMYYLSGLPVWRKINLTDSKTNQTIHESVKEKIKKEKNYRPKNLKGILF